MNEEYVEHIAIIVRNYIYVLKQFWYNKDKDGNVSFMKNTNFNIEIKVYI